jgi:transcriptional regulator with XRE-family HTH domain
MILVRHALGDQLRRRRLEQRRTLRDVSRSARVSLGYLSEVERGRKEPSSELLGSICQALSVPLSVVLRDVSDDLAFQELVSAGSAAAPAGALVQTLPRRTDEPLVPLDPVLTPAAPDAPEPVLDYIAA